MEAHASSLWQYACKEESTRYMATLRDRSCARSPAILAHEACRSVPNLGTRATAVRMNTRRNDRNR